MELAQQVLTVEGLVSVQYDSATLGPHWECSEMNGSINGFPESKVHSEIQTENVQGLSQQQYLCREEQYIARKSGHICKVSIQLQNMRVWRNMAENSGINCKCKWINIFQEEQSWTCRGFPICICDQGSSWSLPPEAATGNYKMLFWWFTIYHFSDDLQSTRNQPQVQQLLIINHHSWHLKRLLHNQVV